MAVFQHCSVLLEVKTLPFKEKTKLKSSVTENGGRICYVVNKQCSLVVTSDVSELSSSRLRGIQKHQTPVVGMDYVYSCLERGLLLPVEDYRLDASSPAASSPPLPPSSLTRQVFKEAAEPVQSVGPSQEAKGGVREEFRVYSATDSDLPTYPENFQVAKYSIFKKMNSWCVLELQSCRAAAGRRYRVVQHWKDDTSTKAAAARDTLVFLSTSEEAVRVYEAQRESLQAAGLQMRTGTPLLDHHLGSAPLQQLLLEEKLHTGRLSQEVGVFVELLWTEALGRLGNVLRVPIDRLSLNDVSRAEGLLLEAQRKLREASPSEAASLLGEVYTLLPHAEPLQRAAPTAKLLSQKLDLCQLIRDVLNVSEATLRSSAPSSLGKYRALRCSIETVAPDTPEFQTVAALLQDGRVCVLTPCSLPVLCRNVQVRRVLRVGRGAELQTFRSEVGNVKPLLHSSSPSNFVGLLSRGLLLPRVGVEHHGIERTDVGHLGSGIYFSDAVSASLKYSAPSRTDGSRLLLVCDVALGRCRDVRHRDATLTQAPEGHHSVHGVRRATSAHSEFEDDEYVVYAADQVKLKYVVQFSVAGERVKEFSPAVDTSEEAPPTSDRGQESMQEDDEVQVNKNPLADVKAGLMDGSGQQLPLQAVHVKCKLMDLLSQVIIFQKYSNQSSAPIEAKYVFPLDDSAAVCGFEAFINGKHVVGQVKEKEAARREYKQAIEKGHGAYLMDQDAPDVFTISVGNLPPGAVVLIKVTFVCELVVRDGSILFSLPGSVAPWQESAALNQTTQVSVEKVCVTDEAREFSLDVSVEMPNKITALQCITHKVKTKRTDCKAVVSVLPGEVMGQDGFQLSITLSDVHLPRMWVEQHPDKDSQASMLVFYPDFEVDSASAPDEVVLLVDASESMKGEPLRAARAVARHVIRTLDHNLRLNIIFFGTDHADAFLTARPLAEARPAAESFIKRSPPVGGSTELWRPLRALSLLPPSRGVRNLLLLSDGHLQNAELALRLLRDNGRHSRLFTCGFSPTANRHMLRALAQAGGGAYEYFDTKTKHNWAEKAACQLKRMASPGCSSVSVKWQQFDAAAPPAVQAPRQLHALFNDCHALVYGFVPHCTQATLLGDLSGQELKTMVSTSELQKTKGTFLHKLTARAVIRDYEDGSLDSNEAEHECKKKELKRFVIELSKEFSILSQFTSFVAVEERDPDQTGEGFTDIPRLISEEDVDFLPYIGWISPQDSEEEESMDMDMDMDMDIECVMEDDDYEEVVYDELVTSDSDQSGYQTAYRVESSPEIRRMRRLMCSDEKDEDGDAALEESAAYVQEKASYEFKELSFSPSYSPTSPFLGLDSRPPRFASSAALLPPHSQASAYTFHPPPPPPPVSQGILHSSSLSGSPHAPPPPPRPGGPPFNRDSLMSSRSPRHESTWDGSRGFDSISLAEILITPSCLAGIKTYESKGMYESLGRDRVGDVRCLVLKDEMAETFSSAEDQSVNLIKSHSAPNGRIRRSQGSQKQHQPNLMPQSMQFIKSPQAESEQAPATPAVLSSGFSFDESQIQVQSKSMSRMYRQASGTILRASQPAEGLSQHYMIKEGKQEVQSLVVGQSPQAESQQAPVTPAVLRPQMFPAGLSSGIGFGGSQIQDQSALRMYGKALETTQSAGQPVEDLSESCVKKKGLRKSQTILVRGFGGSQIQAQSALRMYGKALEITQSAGQPAEDLSESPVLKIKPKMLEKINPMLQSPPVGQGPQTQSEQAPATPGFSFGGSQFQAHSRARRSGDTSRTTQSARQPAEDLAEHYVSNTKPCTLEELKLMLQTPLCAQTPPPEAEQAPVTPAAPSPGFSFSGSRRPRSLSQRSGDSLETTQSARQSADLSDFDCVMREEVNQTPQSQMFGQDREAKSKPVSKLSRLRLEAKTLSRISRDALETTQSARQPTEDLSDLLMLEETSNQSGPPVKLAWSKKTERIQEMSCRPSLSTVHQHAQEAMTFPEALPLKWTKIFQMQQSEGYWELTTELGKLIDFNVDLFANEFLKNKGIQSLGVRAHADILRLVATLLVLQLMRVKSLKEGKLLRTLFSLDDSTLHRPTRWEALKRAVDWVCWADHQYPCVYSRLEFGLSWETCTRQLLGLQGLPPLSALTGLKLQRADRRLLVF